MVRTSRPNGLTALRYVAVRRGMRESKPRRTGEEVKKKGRDSVGRAGFFIVRFCRRFEVRPTIWGLKD